MSYYPSGGRQGGDLYRPRRSAAPTGNSSQYKSANQYGTYGQPYNQRHTQGFDGSSRYQSSSARQYGTSRSQENRPMKDAYQQVYSQSQAENQLWMGDLDQQWTEASIVNIWKELGEDPTSVKIIRDKMGNLQYCFVSFSSLKDVANAIKNKGRQIPGSSRYFKLNWASGGSQGDYKPSHGNRQSGGSIVSRQNIAGKNQQDYSIFVGDLGSDVTEPLLFSHFDKEYPGLVKQVKIMTDTNTGANKGFGFVRFVSQEAQQNALQDTRSIIINHRKIRVGQANGSSLELSAPSKKGETPLTLTIHISQHQPLMSPSTDPHNTLIVVKGLSSAVTKEELAAHFLPFGHLIYCRVNPITNVAHLKYYLRQAAEKALVFMHGFPINGCRITLRWGRESETAADPKITQNVKYSATETPPLLYGDLPQHMLFSNLSRQDLEKLEFVEQSHFLTLEQINLRDKAIKTGRKDYLELAF